VLPEVTSRDPHNECVNYGLLLWGFEYLFGVLGTFLGWQGSGIWWAIGRAGAVQLATVAQLGLVKRCNLFDMQSVQSGGFFGTGKGQGHWKQVGVACCHLVVQVWLLMACEKCLDQQVTCSISLTLSVGEETME